MGWRHAVTTRPAGRCRVRLGSLALLLAPLLCAPGPLHAADQPSAYVPGLTEMTDLFAAQLPAYRVEPTPAADDAWDTRASYRLASSDGGGYELTVAASVLASRAAADEFFRARLAADGIRSLADEAGDAPAWGLDALREYRSLHGRGGQQVSTYGRLAQLDRAVVLVRVTGDPAADLAGHVDNDRALVLVRAFELVLGRLLWYPPGPAREVAGLDPFTRGWSRHGIGLSLDATGHGEVRWRIYRWCTDDPTPPCDDLVGNEIVSGGWASVLFYRVEGSTATGVVIGTDDSEMLALGPALLTLQPYGMATLDQGGRSLQLCGEDYARLAPPDLLRQAPCGA